MPAITIYGSSHVRNLCDYTVDPPASCPTPVDLGYGLQVDVTYICRGGMKIKECRRHLDRFERINAEADLTIFIIGSNDMRRYRRAQAAALALQRLCERALQVTRGTVVLMALLPRYNEEYNKWATGVNDLLVQRIQGQRLHFRHQRPPLRLGPKKTMPSRHLVESDDVHMSKRGNALLYNAVRGAIATFV